MSADLLPTEPTQADFRRLGAIVTMARYRQDPACLWNQEEVAEKLWDAQDGLPFVGLARAAMRAARNPSVKTPASVGHYVAQVAAP
jgi:hypothetical protein